MASAATPATTGAENEVPEPQPYPPPDIVVRTFTPGAARSTLFPVFDHEAIRSLASVALTSRK